MSTTHNNKTIEHTQHYVRSSMQPLDRLHTWTKWTGVGVSGLAGSVWMAGDRAPGSVALAVAFGGALGSLLTGMGPVTWIADDAADSHQARSNYAVPMFAIYLTTLGVAIWSGLWIHLALLAAGAGVTGWLYARLLRAARVQIGRGVDW